MALRWHGADLGVRLRREERVEVVDRLAFLDLPNGRPVRPDAGEAGEGTGLIEREPDVAAVGLVELAERIEDWFLHLLVIICTIRAAATCLRRSLFSSRPCGRA